MELISADIRKSKEIFASIVGPERNFDILNKQMIIGGRLTEFYMIDGLVNDEIMEKLLESFSDFEQENMPEDTDGLVKMIPYTEVSVHNNYIDAVNDMLKGMSCMLIDGYSDA